MIWIISLKWIVIPLVWTDENSSVGIQTRFFVPTFTGCLCSAPSGFHHSLSDLKMMGNSSADQYFSLPAPFQALASFYPPQTLAFKGVLFILFLNLKKKIYGHPPDAACWDPWRFSQFCCMDAHFLQKWCMKSREPVSDWKTDSLKVECFIFQADSRPPEQLRKKSSILGALDKEKDPRIQKGLVLFGTFLDSFLGQQCFTIVPFETVIDTSLHVD